MNNFFKNMTIVGKIAFILIICGLIGGLKYGYDKLNPLKPKITNITTKATGLPPLAYDKSANAPFRALPDFNNPAGVQSPEIRGAIMGWNAFMSASYATGGVTTAKGSICEELGLNMNLSVQNSCSEQGNQLYAFAQALHDGEAQPTKGVNFINWMGDGVPSYLAGLNARLIKDFGDDYRAEVVYFTGTSFGEDKWMLKPKYVKDARGSLTVAVIRDGDWDIAVMKCQLMGWPINNDLGTYDRTKVNFYAAPNDDYVQSGQMYISGAKVTLHLVENGKLTGKDTSLSVTGVASWFPVDKQVLSQKGGIVTAASTKDFDSQMGCAILVIKKWADDNKTLVENMIEAFGRGGDQVKSHDEALKFGAQVNQALFADSSMSADDWYNAYISYPLSDDNDNTMQIGGTRSFNIADAARYVGISGGTDNYKRVYNTFGNVDKEAYPEIVPTFFAYDSVTDWSFLKNVYNKAKNAGTLGNASTTDFSKVQKGDLVGDANYSIQFNTGSAVIKSESYPVLDKIIGQLGVVTNTFVDILGHTDNTGDPEKNKTLSQQRADAVRDYLISKYPELDDPHKLHSNGAGLTKPLDPSKDQNSSSVRASNRRVEIKLTGTK